jgi:hypothetical protein
MSKQNIIMRALTSGTDISSKTFIMFVSCVVSIIVVLSMTFVMVYETFLGTRTLSGLDYVAILGGAGAYIWGSSYGKYTTDQKEVEHKNKNGQQ